MRSTTRLTEKEPLCPLSNLKSSSLTACRASSFAFILHRYSFAPSGLFLFALIATDTPLGRTHPRRCHGSSRGRGRWAVQQPAARPRHPALRGGPAGPPHQVGPCRGGGAPEGGGRPRAGGR